MLRKIIASVCLSILFLAASAQEKKTTVQEYIDTYKDLAVSEMERTGIPASITLAQGILESGNGNSRLAKEGNNHFGIKCKKNWTGATIIEDDDEKGECFRAYETAKDSYLDHSAFLMQNTRYAFLFDLEATDYQGWAKGLKSAGYATNPQYAEIVIGLIERHELHKLDKKEKLPKKSDPIVPAPDVLTMAESEIFKFNKIPATKVLAGQSAISIAKTYGLLPRQLYKYNDLKEGSDIPTGSIVYLKPKKRKGTEAYHTVKPGETMYSIAQLYGIKLKQLYKKNRMETGTEPAVGEVIYMRRKRGTTPSLRTNGGEFLVTVPDADTLKTEPYKEKPMVIIKPGEKEQAKAPKNDGKQPEQTKVKPPKEEKKVFIEKPEQETYNVKIEEKNKQLPIDKKPLDQGEYHTVEKGETMFSIAKKYNKNVEQLKQLNQMADYSLKVGQKLVINENFKEKRPDVDETNYYHEVQKGETMYSVAKKYNMSVDELKKLNNLTTDGLSVGTKLMVSKADKVQPQKAETFTANTSFHTVEKGETLYSISKKYNATVEQIKKWNNLAGNDLKVGASLKVKP